MRHIAISPFIVLLLITHSLTAQKSSIERIEPPNWWSGMVNQELQLMIHGEDVAALQVSVDHPQVVVKQVSQLQNPNYLFVDLDLGGAAAGSFELIFSRQRKEVARESYALWSREEGSASRQGFDPSDVMYLITPDRFVNGDPSNDNVAGMRETADRNNPDGRHGGDIQGILDRLDYIKEMGFTAIWLNPVLENDQDLSYHGYATTDFYRVDARFGSNEQYLELSRRAKDMGIKMIMDMIVNHIGDKHWWMADLPSDDWLNFQSEFEQGEFVLTNHRKSTIQDPYGAPSDLRRFVDGWFVPTMPDLNQRNRMMAEYLIQNSIWWIEYANLAGIRMDTYPYPDMDFMTDWTCRIMAEYPEFNIVGEEWRTEPQLVSYWQRGKQNPNGYTSCLPGLMDFPMQAALVKGLIDEEQNYSGLMSLYEMLGYDFLYAEPENLVIFPDNHDMSRFYTQVNHDYDLFKLGLVHTLTMRGIPQIYYGTEILMSNPDSDDHGVIRSDFPGGWAGDPVNAFTGVGLTDQQREAKAFLQKLLRWRKSAKAVHEGKLMHYNPINGTYVYFRYTSDEKVMIVLNKSKEETKLDLTRFADVIGDSTMGEEVLSGTQVRLTGTLTLPPNTPMVIDFK